jgi:hypothetical protein
MAQIYGELIRAQLQVSASDLSSPVIGLVYFNSTTGAKWHTGSAWKVAVDLDSSQTLSAKTLDSSCIINSSALPVVPLAKGGLGADASAWSGFVKIAAGSASAAAIGLSDLPLITPSKGGTGVANNDAATLTRSGNHAVTLTTTATTSLTLPTTGTLATTADITMANLTGTLVPSKGGTGVSNNDAATLTRSGNHAVTLTTTGTTGVTLPTTGTLATLSGVEVLLNKDINGDIASNTSRITIPKASRSALDLLTRKQATILYASDSNKVFVDDGSALKEIGGSAGTGRNYLQEWFDGTNAIGTVLTGLTTTGTRTVNGTADKQWGASSTSNMTVSLDSATPLRQTSSIKIDSLNTTISAFVETPLFSIDTADYGKPLSIEFDIGDVSASTNYDVVVIQYALNGVYEQTISVAGNASTGTPASAQLPTGITKFRGFFIPAGDGSHYYALRVRKLAAVDDDFLIDSLFVGPQSLAQGAIVTAWQSYTPTFSAGFGTVTSIDAKYQRVGNSLKVSAKFTTGTVAGTIASISIPTGITIDTSSQKKIVGLITTQKSTTADFVNTALAFVDTGDTTVIKFCNVASTGATQNLSSANGNFLWSSSTIQSVQFEVPIAEWSSGTTTLADRAVEEYAWNTNTTTSLGNGGSDTTSFGNGPQGIAVASFTTSGVNTPCTRRVRFTTPILSTDSVFLELFLNGQWMKWTDFYTVLTQNAAGTARAGITVIPVSGSTTDYDVNFYGLGPSLTADTQWADAVARSARWRVRKVSGGAAVGFPVSARNVVGDTSGTVVPAGYVGERLSFVNASSVNIFNTTQNIVTATIPAGIWDIHGYTLVDYVIGSSSQHTLGFSIDTTSATLNDPNLSQLLISYNANVGFRTPPTRIIRYSFSSTTTVYLIANVGGITGGMTAATSRTNSSTIIAIRIA